MSSVFAFPAIPNILFPQLPYCFWTLLRTRRTPDGARVDSLQKQSRSPPVVFSSHPRRWEIESVLHPATVGRAISTFCDVLEFHVAIHALSHLLQFFLDLQVVEIGSQRLIRHRSALHREQFRSTEGGLLVARAHVADRQAVACEDGGQPERYAGIVRAAQFESPGEADRGSHLHPPRILRLRAVRFHPLNLGLQSFLQTLDRVRNFHQHHEREVSAEETGVGFSDVPPLGGDDARHVGDDSGTVDAHGVDDREDLLLLGEGRRE